MDTLTFPEFTGTNGAVWNLAPVPKAEVEPVACRSSYPRLQSPAGFLVCRVDHAEQGTDVHGAPVGDVWFPWTTQAAAAAWERVDRCTRECCGQVVEPGQSYCSTWCRLQDKNPDERDLPESEAAA